jgi:choline dehydrogenase
MVYNRGNHADYDEWRQRGCTGWGWEGVLPYFRKAEDQERGADAFHGTGGPLGVSDFPRDWPLAKATVEAMKQAGILYNPDFNGVEQEGCGYYQSMTRRRRRSSAASAYLAPALGRSNLVVRTKAHATRVLFEGRRAIGVEYLTPRGLQTARAAREVVVAGGTYGSPQLLQLSGLGPAGLLNDMSIPVVLDMPAVGANLHDHFNTYLVFRCSSPVTINDLALSLPRRLWAGAQYFLFRRGPLANNNVYAGAFVRSDPLLERPDLQLNMWAWAAAERTARGIKPHPFSAFTLSPVHLRPEGRGEVRIKNPDPLKQPAVRFNFLKTRYDIEALMAGMRMCRTIALQPALADFVTGEVVPGSVVSSDDQLEADIRQRGVSNSHPVGTCRMGPGTDCVVDPRLRVHGIERLRVADASIMPSIIAGNTAAPTIMIGEKAADMLLEDARRLG